MGVWRHEKQVRENQGMSAARKQLPKATGMQISMRAPQEMEETWMNKLPAANLK